MKLFLKHMNQRLPRLALRKITGARLGMAALALSLVLSSFATPVRTAYAVNQLILNPVGGPFGMVVLRLPAGGEAAFTLEGATIGTSFVRMRVDWAAVDTRVQQIRITNVPGGPILGFDLNSSIFSPQPRDPNQIVLNVQPPTRTFHDSFIFELAGGLSPSQIIGQFLIEDLTTGATVEKSNVPIIFDPRITNSTIDLSGGGTQSGGVILSSGGQLIGGNGASVTGQVTTLPGSTVQVTQGQFTLGDGTAPIDLRGLVTVAPNTTLNLNSSTKTQLGGQTDVTKGTISAPNGMNFGTPSSLDASQLAGADLETLLAAVGAERSEVLQQVMMQQIIEMKAKNDAIRNSIEPTRTQLLQQQQMDMLKLQATAAKQAATSELVNSLIKNTITIAAPIVGTIRSTLAGDVEVVGSLLIGGPQDIGHTDINGTLTMHTGSQLAMEVAGTNAGQFDSVTASGNVTFENGSILKLGLLDPNDFANGTNLFAPQPFDFDQFDLLTAAHITNNGLLLDAPPFPDRTFAIGIFDNPNGTQTLRLLVGPLPTTSTQDTTPPVIAANVAGTLGSNGWYRSDVAVSWTVSDAESAITSQTGCDPVTINTDTPASGTTSTCSATSAGGTNSQSVTIKRDATAPVVNITGVSSGATYALGNVPVAGCDTQDATSGVATPATLSLSGGNPHGVGTFTVACSSASDLAGNTSASLSAPYTVRYNLSKFVMLGQEGIELDQRTNVHSGDIGANAASGGPFLGNQSEVSVGQDVALLDASSHVLGDSLFVRQGATVYNPGYNELTNNGTALGASATPLDLSLMPSLPALPVITPGSQDFDVPQQGTLALNAGNYGVLKARARATITFAGGVYHFAAWDIGEQATLHFLAPTEIRIAGKLAVDQRSTLGPAPSATGLSAKDIVIYVGGQNGNTGALGGDPKAAQFGQQSIVMANVFAPNGTILLRQRTEATGAFIGKWVQAGQQVKLTFNSAF